MMAFVLVWPGSCHIRTGNNSFTPSALCVTRIQCLTINLFSSGTSFTLHITRETSNATTASNYALEGDIKDQPSVLAIPDGAGRHGPVLHRYHGKYTNIPETILTKTHCNGYCTPKNCKAVQTVHSFMDGCLSGTRAYETEKGLLKIQQTYDKSLVKKAIHLFRHPLDNIVSRFHLSYKQKETNKYMSFLKDYSKDRAGFRRWCRAIDKNKDVSQLALVDQNLREALDGVPCAAEFFRYAQWHNLAFWVTNELNLPTMILHYDEYAKDLRGTASRVLNFLDIPRVGKGVVQFHSGKTYRNYYTLEERRKIRSFLQKFSSLETWEQLKDYDFENRDGQIMRPKN